MRRASNVVTALWFAGLVLLMAAILTQLLPDLVPAGPAKRIGFNSEGYTMAIVVAAWIACARPRLTGRRSEWPLTVAAGLACTLIGIGLLTVDVPSRFRTLNETFFALTLVLPYLQLRRPLPRWVPLVFSGSFFLVVVVFFHSPLVTDLAETLGALVLLPLAVDLFDPEVLDRGARPSRGARFGFYAALVVLPITMSVIQHEHAVTGFWNTVTRYGIRMHESFICVVLVLALFAVRRALEHRTAADREPQLVR